VFSIADKPGVQFGGVEKQNAPDLEAGQTVFGAPSPADKIAGTDAAIFCGSAASEFWSERGGLLLCHNDSLAQKNRGRKRVFVLPLPTPFLFCQSRCRYDNSRRIVLESLLGRTLRRYGPGFLPPGLFPQVDGVLTGTLTGPS